jgi:hypothetical protein
MTKTLSGRGLTAAGVLSLFVSYGRPLGKYIERPLWLGNEFFPSKKHHARGISEYLRPLPPDAAAGIKKAPREEGLRCCFEISAAWWKY